MPLVNVTVNDRSYTISCDEGEEDHLRELAALVDSKMRELAETVGQPGEPRLLLMAALVIADSQVELRAQLENRTHEIAVLAEEKEKLERRLAELEQHAAAALDSAAKRLDDIAVR